MPNSTASASGFQPVYIVAIVVPIVGVLVLCSLIILWILLYLRKPTRQAAAIKSSNDFEEYDRKFAGNQGRQKKNPVTTTWISRESPSSNAKSAGASDIGFHSTPNSDERAITPFQYSRVRPVAEEEVPTPDVGQRAGSISSFFKSGSRRGNTTLKSPRTIAGVHKDTTDTAGSPRSKISTILRPILVLARDNSVSATGTTRSPRRQPSSISDSDEQYVTPPRLSLHLSRVTKLVPSELLRMDDDSKSLASSVAHSTHSKIKQISTPRTGNTERSITHRSTPQRVTPKHSKLENPRVEDSKKIKRRGTSLTHRSTRTVSSVSSVVRKPALDKPLPEMPSIGQTHVYAPPPQLQLTSTAKNSPDRLGLSKPWPSLKSKKSDGGTASTGCDSLANPHGCGAIIAASASSTSPSSSMEGVVAILEKEYEVLHPYKPDLSDELELRLGDRVMIYEVFDDGWCYGRITNQFPRKIDAMIEGICPAACLRPLFCNK